MGDFLVSLSSKPPSFRTCAGCEETGGASPTAVYFSFPTIADGTCSGCSGFLGPLEILCSEETECVWNECFVTYCGGKTVELFFHYDSVDGEWELYGVDTADPMTILFRYTGPATWDGASPIVLTFDFGPADCIWPLTTTLELEPA